MTGGPIQLEWASADSRILAEAKSAAAGGPMVIGITGPVGSGKSTLARRLSEGVIATDDYLPDYHLIPAERRDDPESSHLAELAEHLRLLRNGEAVEIPVWSFQTHRRVGTRRVQPRDVLVVEGIHALSVEVRPLLDVAVFVDAPRADRWSRWESIEAAGERGWGVERARAFFDEVAEPTFERLRPGYLAAADFVVSNPG